MNDPRPLAALTTMGVGGVPEKLRVATNREEILDQAAALWREADEWLVIGGGSNLVVADQVPHLQALHIASKGVEASTEGNGRIRLVVQAGENWE